MKMMHTCVPLCSSRWVHAVCESLYTEDEVEQASDEGFACTYCAPYVPKPVGKSENVFRKQHSMSDLLLLFLKKCYYFLSTIFA